LDGRYNEIGAIHPRFPFVEVSRRKRIGIDVIGLGGLARIFRGSAKTVPVDRVDYLDHVDAF
jgi:hypothetical protein